MAQRNERTEEGDLNGFNSSEDLRIPLCSEEDFFCGYANANSIDRTEPEAQMKTSSHLMPQMEMEKGEREPTLLLEEFAPQAWLEDEYRRFALCGSEVLIGRDENCAVVLLDPSVSGTHAKLTCAQERWYVQDLKSTNGTRLDRKKVIRRMRLKEGMTLHLGNVELVFHE